MWYGGFKEHYDMLTLSYQFFISWLFKSFKFFHIFSIFSDFLRTYFTLKAVMCYETMFMISATLMMLLYWSDCRLLMLVYLLYISIFTLCCINRPLKDIPENYTKAANDKTIKVQKSFTVWNIILMFLYIKALLYLQELNVFLYV